MTVVLALLVPPGPLHASENDAVVFRLPVGAEPVVAFAPDHPPEAMQLVAFEEVHDSVDAEPRPIVAGLADRDTVGAGGAAVIVTVTDRVAAPPDPVQLSMNVLVALRAPVLSLPLNGLFPVQPSEAVQIVVLLLVHVRIELPPETTDVGFADSVTTGGGGPAVTVTVVLCVTEPPSPEQERVNVLVAESGPVPVVPLEFRGPLQPPPAVQLDAFVAFHVSVDDPPTATAAGLAVRVSVGTGAVTETSTDFAAVPPAPLQAIE